MPSSGFPERVNHAPDQSVSHRHGHNLVSPLDNIAFFDFGVVAEQHHAYLILFQVQRNPGHAVREREHLAFHALLQAVNARDAVADRNHRADFVHLDGLLVVLNLLFQYFCDLVRFDVRHYGSYSVSSCSRNRFS